MSPNTYLNIMDRLDRKAREDAREHGKYAEEYREGITEAKAIVKTAYLKDANRQLTLNMLRCRLQEGPDYMSSNKREAWRTAIRCAMSML